jgi:hypothetical protein
MFLLFLTLQVFGASDSLHKLLHADAASPTHQCAITLISQGQFEQPPLNLRPAIPADFILSEIIYAAPALASCDHLACANRGPPSVS